MRLAFWRKPVQRAADPAAPLSDIGPVKRKRMLNTGLFGMFKSGQYDQHDAWGGTPVSADQLVTRLHKSLVARSREQWTNNDFVKAFHRLIRQNVVGPIGVTLQAKATTPRGKLDKAVNEAIEADWCDWGDKGNCEVTGKLSWREIQCLLTETTARDGEFIVRFIYGPDAGPHGFALQLIDPQRLPSWYENYQRTEGGGFIRHGIEFNRYGKPVAYHFVSTEEWDAYYYSYNGQGFVRVPADEILHGFLQEMVGQRRGLPWAATSLFSLHHQQGMQDAAVQNARAGSSKMGFIQYKEGFGPELEDDDALHIEAEPLGFVELPEGAELKEFSPQYPSGEFAVFNKAMLRRAASGMGVPYNELANDLEGVNFSSIRQLTLDAREHYKEIQQWLIETLCGRVFKEWLKWRLLNGAIKANGKPLPPEKLATYLKVCWQPRRWQWIDPRADVDGAIASIRAGLTSPSQVIREQGRDPETVFAEIAADVEAMKAAGIDDELIELFFTGQPPQPEPEPPKDGGGKTED